MLATVFGCKSSEPLPRAPASWGTDGIDIIPATREENLHALERALEDLDARRADGKPLCLSNLPGPVVELETRAGELKLVPEPAGTRGWDDLRRRAGREPLELLATRYLSLRKPRGPARRIGRAAV